MGKFSWTFIFLGPCSLWQSTSYKKYGAWAQYTVFPYSLFINCVNWFSMKSVNRFSLVEKCHSSNLRGIFCKTFHDVLFLRSPHICYWIFGGLCPLVFQLGITPGLQESPWVALFAIMLMYFHDSYNDMRNPGTKYWSCSFLWPKRFWGWKCGAPNKHTCSL